MAITNCKKHGRVHFTEICPHAAEHIGRGSYGSFHYIHMWPSGVLVCDECLHKYGFTPFKDHPGLPKPDQTWFEIEVDDRLWGEYYEAYKRFKGRKICCDECIAAARVSQAQH